MNEKELYKRFAQLRDEERRGVPPFAVPAQARKRRIAWPLIAAPAALLIIVILIVAIRPRTTSFSDSDRAVARSVAAWHPPTDFLLRTPGSEMLTTTPRIPDLKGIPR
ncbi:MAG: hypothetical protein QOK37_2399 [Thermoanaerobaculia bacterium]|jgi:hypothetical protein|nr:hypothetical protein [Thermoanaerobaculia bacterium]